MVSPDKKEPVNPCDPKKPCDPYDTDGGECPKPTICMERLKNPMIPHETRCKTGAHLGVSPCASEASTPHHPCDPPEPCVSGKQKKKECSAVSISKKRIKNPEPEPFNECPIPDDF